VDRKWAWLTPGNVRVDLPDLPLKYGPDTTSRFEVIEFTVIDFLGKSWAFHCLFPHLLLFLAIEKTQRPKLSPTEPCRNEKSQNSFPSISHTGSRWLLKFRRYKSSDLGRALPETENRKWIQHSHRLQWRHQHGTFENNRKITIFKRPHLGQF